MAVLKKKNPEINQVKTTKKTSKSNVLFMIMYLVIVLIIILSGLKIFILHKQFANIINKNTYQIVTLENGESYFGKLQNLGYKYYELSDVYYVKYNAKTDSTDNTNTTAENYELQLISLGQQEFYKPQNVMIINRDKILHFENLQSDSEVIKYINQQ
ncbi:MAG: hypothetical protein V1898_04205 [Patescibacteria group bacterium]